MLKHFCIIIINFNGVLLTYCRYWCFYFSQESESEFFPSLKIPATNTYSIKKKINKTKEFSVIQSQQKHKHKDSNNNNNKLALPIETHENQSQISLRNQPLSAARVKFLSARRGHYLATVSCCAHSERGGVSIWQVRLWRVCERLAKQRPANGHRSQSQLKNRNHIIFDCPCNDPDDISTSSALISSKLPSLQASATETNQEIDASCSALLFVLTW